MILLMAVCVGIAAPPAFAKHRMRRAAFTAADSDAGRWKTFVLASGSQLRPAPPATAHSRVSKGELAEVVVRQKHLTPAWAAAIQAWDAGAITRRWTETLLAQIVKNRLNPVRAARAIALLHVAMYDATVASWDAKYAYGLESPAQASPSVRALVALPVIPSFPSEHAAVGAAAAAVLSDLFPADAAQFDAMAAEAGESRIRAGASFPSDVSAGQALGTQVGALVVERGRSDGSSAVFTGMIPSGPGIWTPPPTGALLEPMAGTWRTWILASGSELQPPPPPVFGSPENQADIDAVIQTQINLTPGQKAIALFWADGGGTVTPPGHWMQIAAGLVDPAFHGSAPQAARAMALTGVSLADAVFSCWYTKYVHWRARPFQEIAGFSSIIPTPPFPAYTSGHSTFSGAAATVLAYLFPAQSASLQAMAEEAAVSRLYAGIHYPTDDDNGLAVGRQIGAKVVAYGQGDGSGH